MNASSFTMAKEMVGGRVDATTRHDMEALAKASGRNLSEEIELAIMEHVDRSTALVVPESIVESTAGTEVTMTPAEVRALLRVNADLETVRAFPREVVPALHLFLEEWAHTRWCAPRERSPVDGTRVRWVRSWVEDRIERLAIAKPPLSTLSALRRAGLLPGSHHFRERVSMLTDALVDDADRHVLLDDWTMRLTVAALDGLTEQERCAAREAERLRNLSQRRANLILRLRSELADGCLDYSTLSSWSKVHIGEIAPDLYQFILESGGTGNRAPYGAEYSPWALASNILAMFEHLSFPEGELKK